MTDRSRAISRCNRGAYWPGLCRENKNGKDDPLTLNAGIVSPVLQDKHDRLLNLDAAALLEQWSAMGSRQGDRTYLFYF